VDDEPETPGHEHFLLEAASRAPGQEVSLSIRDFIAKWGAKRRGYWFVQEIQQALDEHALTTEPSFETGWIDNHIRLVRKREDGAKPGSPAGADGISEDQQTTSLTTGTALKVSSLKTAASGVISVSHSDTLDLAQSLMMRYDYSQLPVLSGAREVLGVVSWESIAQKRIHQADCNLRDCVVPVDVVGIEDDLLPHIPRIIESGYVFVRAQDKTICGVVTTTDLSANFLMLAGPFLLIGEVERRLRQVVSISFTLDEISAGKDERDAGRVVSSVNDLTLGETIRLFQPREGWDKLGWQVDRAVFCSALEASVALRNDIMHFSPDPIEEERLNQVRYLLKWLNLLV